MIITALNCDEFYYEQLLVLLTSIRTNSPDDDVSIFLVNFPSEVEKNLTEIFDGFMFENRKLDVGDNIAGFMVCYRSLVIKECLEKYKKPVAWFDTDVIVRKDLEAFWEGVSTNQLKISYRGDDVAPKIRFQAGVFAVGYSEATIKFISEWNSIVQSKHEWYADQLHLYLTYMKYSDSIELIKMPRIFNDIGDSTRDDVFDAGSTIWHCKKSHFYHERFRKEHLKYFHMLRLEEDFSKWNLQID